MQREAARTSSRKRQRVEVGAATEVNWITSINSARRINSDTLFRTEFREQRVVSSHPLLGWKEVRGCGDELQRGVEGWWAKCNGLLGPPCGCGRGCETARDAAEGDGRGEGGIGRTRLDSYWSRPPSPTNFVVGATGPDGRPSSRLDFITQQSKRSPK